jgi:hypothetical protein
MLHDDPHENPKSWQANPTVSHGDVFELTDEVWHIIGPDDGSGYWGYGVGYCADAPLFVDGKRTAQPEWATHLVWYNK